jgi:peptidoglycan/LPS O-acetylase OafA/YrhL
MGYQVQENREGKVQISRSNNFDLLRFLLAFSVCLHHLGVLTKSPEMNQIASFLHPIITQAVPSFFVISGFLIFMSYENSKSIREYTEKRAKRILPAYVLVVVLCSLFGVLRTDLPWNQYFNMSWCKYLIANLTFLNSIQPSLPGVFTTNPLPSIVNGSLWTIKIEIMFYASVPVFSWLFRKYNKLWLIGIFYCLSIAYREILTYFSHELGNSTLLELSRQLPGQLSFFLSGALILYYLDFFRKYYKYFLGLAIAILTLNFAESIPIVNSFVPLSLAVTVISIALYTPHINLFTKYGDLSYGIYIYHFPIIQTLISLGLFRFNPYLGFGTLMLMMFSASYLSWHLLEKKFMQRRPSKALLT